ncbi:hypothetical protein FNV43_RR10941 [Rhamnella rubrinervis]|uniref:Uncharacterized protein n=1 Tax=Rhamnella rubrinervis TaxID=2594499 RepID=A0A8K0H512_9ROSA|nr:hypothetical protein FNV43_RR10941 [Rhamnella rubrinervis]
MEISETDGETGGTLEFDFLFDEVDLLTNQETTQAPSNHQNETAASISTDKGDQLGASGESDKAQANPHEVDTILNASQVVELQKHGATCEISSGTTSFVNALNLAQQGLLISAPPPPPTPQPYPPSATGNPPCTQLVPMTSNNANAWETSRPSSTPFSWTTIPQPPLSPAPAPTTPFQTVDQPEANQLQMINYPLPYQRQPNINIAAYNPNDQNVKAPHRFDKLPLPQQPNQVMAANNVTDPQFMPLPQQATSFRPAQQLPKQPQQVQPMAPNFYDPNCVYTMQPGFCMPPLRPPQFAYATYQQPNDQMRPIVQDSFQPAGSSMPSRVRIQPLNDAQVNQCQRIQMMPNVVVPQLSNTVPPADHHQQPLMKSAGLQQVSMTPTVCNPLQNSFVVTGPRTLLRPQQASDQHQQQVNIGTPMMGNDDDDHTPHDPQLDSTPVDHPALESPSVHSRQNTLELQEILNNRRTNTKPTAAVPTYQTYVLNSLTERERRDHNTTALTIPTQSKSSSPSKLKEQRTSERVERRSRKAGKRKGVGDLSVPSKRSKKEEVGRQEKRSTASKSSAANQEVTVVNNRTSQSEENEADNSSVSDPLITLRRVKNACYDPRFESKDRCIWGLDASKGFVSHKD